MCTWYTTCSAESNRTHDENGAAVVVYILYNTIVYS